MEQLPPNWWEDFQQNFTATERDDPSHTKSAWLEMLAEYKPISSMEEAESFKRECMQNHQHAYRVVTVALATTKPDSDLEAAENFQQELLERYPQT